MPTHQAECTLGDEADSSVLYPRHSASLLLFLSPKRDHPKTDLVTILAIGGPFAIGQKSLRECLR